MAALKSLDDAIRPLSMRNYSTAMKALQSVTQKEAARLLNCAESSLSEFKEDHLERAMQVIAAVGLKVVPKDERTFPAAEIAALKLFARKAMDQEDAVTQPGDL